MSGQEEGCLPHGERVPYAIPRGQTREPGCTCPVTYFDPTPEPVDVGTWEALTDWSDLAASDGWDDVDGQRLQAAAIDAIAWALLEAASDTADREPSAAAHAAATATASRLLAARDATVAAKAKAEALREAAGEVQAVYDLQCPPQRSHFADDNSGRGAHCAHMWWSTVLGGTLRRLRDRATESGRP